MAKREGDRADGRVSCGIPAPACGRRVAFLFLLFFISAGLLTLRPALAAAQDGALRARVEAPNGSPIGDAVLSLVPLDGGRGAAGAARRATMDQAGLEFVPHVLAVAAGTVVDFPNSDQVRHSLYSFSAAKRFEVKLYRGFEAPPITFETPGLVVLGCNIHDHMVGFIYVLDAPHFGVSDAAGEVEIPNVPAGRYRLEVRHPRLEESVVTAREVALPLASPLVIALGEEPPPRPPARPEVDPLQSLFEQAPR